MRVSQSENDTLVDPQQLATESMIVIKKYCQNHLTEHPPGKASTIDSNHPPIVYQLYSYDHMIFKLVGSVSQISLYYI